MKTILVVYTNGSVGRYDKRYAFNTNSVISKGDVLKSKTYSTNMTVVKVMDEEFKYFNKVTGKLTNDFNNANLYKIRTLKLVNNDNTVFAVKV